MLTNEEKLNELIQELGEVIFMKNCLIKKLTAENSELKKKVEELTK